MGFFCRSLTFSHCFGEILVIFGDMFFLRFHYTHHNWDKVTYTNAHKYVLAISSILFYCNLFIYFFPLLLNGSFFISRTDINKHLTCCTVYDYVSDK